jgi:mono/diheme cytochrome c family protein
MRTRTGPLSLAALALVATAVACKIDPKKPVVHYSLADSTRALKADGEPVIPLDVQDHILGSLEMLFGTPSNPQFMQLKAWVDDGFNPNWPTYAKGDNGSSEISPEEQEKKLWPDNERAFRRQLASIDSGHFDQVVPPDTAPDLCEKWNALMTGTAPDKRDAEFTKNAREMFLQWYPTLRDSAEMYRQQCLHCHGPEGGGNGPTGKFLNPRPRDYRLGVFKFTAVNRTVPRHADLVRILDEGVTGTAMPSFRRFSKAQLCGLADYVRLLSLRGMVERDLALTYSNNENLPAEYVPESYATMWSKWNEAPGKLIVAKTEVPPPTPESIAHGKQLFMDDKSGNCVSCHGLEGRGNGVSAFVTDPETGITAPQADDWNFPNPPRNLTIGIFRGGRRPIDIYRRIYSGIYGSKMPGIGESKKPDGSPLLTDSDIWSLVHYVGSLAEQPQHVHVADASGHTGESQPHEQH